MLRYIPEHINQFCIAALDVQFIHLLHEGVVQVVCAYDFKKSEKHKLKAIFGFSVI